MGGGHLEVEGASLEDVEVGEGWGGEGDAVEFDGVGVDVVGREVVGYDGEGSAILKTDVNTRVER